MNATECGGCQNMGSHRQHCPRHPDYHPWRLLADRAESIGDSIGVPSLANQAWALAGAIREAIPDHPYRRHALTTTSEDAGTIRWLAVQEKADEMRRQNPGWRHGQALFNALHAIDPHLANGIRGTHADPFYDVGSNRLATFAAAVTIGNQPTAQLAQPTPTTNPAAAATRAQLAQPTHPPHAEEQP